MAITKQQKAEIVKRMEGIVSDASTLVFAKFTNLTVAEQTELRRALRAQDVGYTVAKKTLMRRALDAAKIEGTAPELEGEIAIAYGKDELAPARELAVFVKKFSEHLSFAGGVFGGKYVDAAGIKAIAAIPGMESLRGMFAQLMNSPMQRFAVVLSKVAEVAPKGAAAPAETPAPAEVVEAPTETVETPAEAVEAPAAEVETPEQTS